MDSVSLGNVVCLTSRTASDAPIRLIHDPSESEVQEVKVVFDSSVPPILSVSSDSSSAEMVEAPVMEMNLQLVMVVDEAL